MPAPRASSGLLLAAALVAATLANGLGPYAKRVGWVDHDAWRAYWPLHCARLALEERTERQCGVFTTPEAVRRHVGTPLPDKEAMAAHLYVQGPAGNLLKLAKDVLWIALLVACASRLVAAWRQGARPAPGAHRGLGAILLLLAADTLLGAGMALAAHGGLVATAGVRGMLFLGLALLGRPVLGALPAVATAAAVLLALQLALMPPELLWGMHLAREWGPWDWATRLAGTLTQPSSLGIFAVAALAFFQGFRHGRGRWLPAAAVAALLLVLLSASGTAAVCGAALAGWTLLARAPAARRPWLAGGALLGVAAVVAALPLLQGRWDIYESLVQRLDTLQAALQRPWPQVLLGNGLGWNTNTALALGRPGLQGPDGPVPSDSALLSLLLQLGVLGAALFCAALLVAAWRDACARGFYLVIALAMLTSNVTELFPVNLLLGLALAHSLWAATPPARP